MNVIIWLPTNKGLLDNTIWNRRIVRSDKPKHPATNLLYLIKLQSKTLTVIYHLITLLRLFSKMFNNIVWFVLQQNE